MENQTKIRHIETTKQCPHCQKKAILDTYTKGYFCPYCGDLPQLNKEAN